MLAALRRSERWPRSGVETTTESNHCLPTSRWMILSRVAGSCYEWTVDAPVRLCREYSSQHLWHFFRRFLTRERNFLSLVVFPSYPRWINLGGPAWKGAEFKSDYKARHISSVAIDAAGNSLS